MRQMLHASMLHASNAACVNAACVKPCLLCMPDRCVQPRHAHTVRCSHAWFHPHECSTASHVPTSAVTDRHACSLQTDCSCRASWVTQAVRQHTSEACQCTATSLACLRSTLTWSHTVLSGNARMYSSVLCICHMKQLARLEFSWSLHPT